MSRRSRKRRGAGETRWLGKVAVLLLVLGVVGFGVGYGLIRNYLHSDAFRKFLSAEASEMAGVQGEFALFRWEGLAVETDSFQATSQGPVTVLRADDLHTEIGLGGLKRGVWEVKGSRLRRLDLTVDARKRAASPATPPPVPVESSSEKTTPRGSWFPSEAELQGLEIGELTAKITLEQGVLTAGGFSVKAERIGPNDAYRADISGGKLHLPTDLVPELRVEQAKVRYQDRQIFLTDATVAAWSNARLQGSGEWDMRSRRYSIEGDASGIRSEELLNPDWAQRLAGDVTSNFSVNNHAGFPQASGKLTLHNGVLTALPMLDALAAYADTRRFRVLALNEAHTDWQWNKDALSLQNLVLSSEGLVRLEGSITLRGQQLDGTFRLGLAPGTLSTIPGAETDVFLPGERGLLWTPLRITGTLDRPREDLTDRLIAAAGLRMFDQLPESGEKVIKFTHSVLGESSSKTVEKGLEIIEKNSDVIREVGGILDGILGSGRREKPKPEHQAQ
ncbi:MAG: hypothetical protein ACRCXD_04090 [Luteolibacter sp.]